MASRFGELLDQNFNRIQVRNYVYEGTCYGWFHKYQPQIICSLICVIFVVVIGAGGVIYLNNGNIYARDCWPNTCISTTEQSSQATSDVYIYQYEDYNFVLEPNYYEEEEPLGWTFRFPTPTNRNLLSVAYGEGVGFVAVGEDDTILISLDGIDWTLQDLPTLHHSTYTSISYGAGVFWLRDDNQFNWISRDANEWVASEYYFPSGIVYDGNDLYMGVEDGKLYSHNASKQWTPLESDWQQVEITDATWISSIVYGNGLFVAFGYSSMHGLNAVVWASEDGIEWIIKAVFLQQYIDGPNIYAYTEEKQSMFIRYVSIDDQQAIIDAFNMEDEECADIECGGYFVIYFEELFVSPDTVNWKTVSSEWGPLSPPSALECGMLGVCIGISASETFQRSLIGTSLEFALKWKSSFINDVYNDIAYDGVETFVIVGDDGKILHSLIEGDYHSQSLSFSVVGANDAYLVDNLVFGDGEFISVGKHAFNLSNVMIRSIDGYHWNTEELDTAGLSFDVLCFGEQIYVGVSVYETGFVIYQSTDNAKSWIYVEMVEGDFSILQLVHLNQMFILSIVDNSLQEMRFVVSSDGLVWEVITPSFQNLEKNIKVKEVVYSGLANTFYALSDSGFIFISANLTSFRIIFSDAFCQSIAVNQHDGVIAAACKYENRDHPSLLVSLRGAYWEELFSYDWNFLSGNLMYYYLEDAFFLVANDVILATKNNFKDVSVSSYPFYLQEISNTAIGNNVLSITSKSAILSCYTNKLFA